MYPYVPRYEEFCKVKITGNITAISIAPRSSPGFKKLNRDSYMILKTGEVKKFNHILNRAQSVHSIRDSIGRLRDLINCNVTDSSHCLWVTLTYRENMTDTKRLYDDFRQFWRKFKRWLNRQHFDIPEYITVIEPQGRGAWHIHGIFIFPSDAPYVSNNDVMERLWEHGYTKVKRLKTCDNLGAYLSAYLCDLPVDEESRVGAAAGEIVEKVVNSDGIPVKKQFLKGSRLHMYPPGTKLYRTSRGIKRPISEIMMYGCAKNVAGVRNRTPTYISDFDLFFASDDSYSNYSDDDDNLKSSRCFAEADLQKRVIHHEYYNALR